MLFYPSAYNAFLDALYVRSIPAQWVQASFLAFLIDDLACPGVSGEVLAKSATTAMQDGGGLSQAEVTGVQCIKDAGQPERVGR